MNYHTYPPRNFGHRPYRRVSPTSSYTFPLNGRGVPLVALKPHNCRNMPDSGGNTLTSVVVGTSRSFENVSGKDDNGEVSDFGAAVVTSTDRTLPVGLKMEPTLTSEDLNFKGQSPERICPAAESAPKHTSTDSYKSDAPNGSELRIMALAFLVICLFAGSLIGINEYLTRLSQEQIPFTLQSQIRTSSCQPSYAALVSLQLKLIGDTDRLLSSDSVATVVDDLFTSFVSNGSAPREGSSNSHFTKTLLADVHQLKLAFGQLEASLTRSTNRMMADNFLALKLLQERSDGPNNVLKKLVNMVLDEILVLEGETSSALATITRFMAHGVGIEHHVQVPQQFDLLAHQLLAQLEETGAMFDVLKKRAGKMLCVGMINTRDVPEQFILNLEYGIQKLREGHKRFGSSRIHS